MVRLMHSLRIYINHPFLKIFYEKLKKWVKKLVIFLFFHKKKNLKWITIVCPKSTRY